MAFSKALKQQRHHDDTRKNLEQARQLQLDSDSRLLELAKVANHQNDYVGRDEEAYGCAVKKLPTL